MSFKPEYRLRSNRADKLTLKNKYLQIPSFTFDAGEAHRSLYLEKNINAKTRPVTIPVGDLTIEFWVKCYITGSQYGNTLLFKANDFNFSISTEGYLYVKFGEFGSGNQLISTDLFTFGDWVHVALTHNNAGTLCLYINGILQETKQGFLVSAETPIQIGYWNNGLFGYISEVRLWKSCRSAEEIKNSVYGSKSIYFEVEPNLICYWKCNELTEDNRLKDIVGAEHMTFYKENALLEDFSNLMSTEYWPRHAGASWPIAQGRIDLGRQLSIKFPTNPPVGTTCALVVRWTDEDSSTQRRYLWTVDGVEFGGINVTAYVGETLSAPFFLEVWPIDSAESAVVTAPTKLRLSLTSLPISSLDIVEESVGNLTLSNSIFSAELPAAFPLTFNQPPFMGAQQVMLNLVSESGDIIL